MRRNCSPYFYLHFELHWGWSVKAYRASLGGPVGDAIRCRRVSSEESTPTTFAAHHLSLEPFVVADSAPRYWRAFAWAKLFVNLWTSSRTDDLTDLVPSSVLDHRSFAAMLERAKTSVPRKNIKWRPRVFEGYWHWRLLLRARLCWLPAFRFRSLRAWASNTTSSFQCLVCRFGIMLSLHGWLQCSLPLSLGFLHVFTKKCCIQFRLRVGAKGSYRTPDHWQDRDLPCQWRGPNGSHDMGSLEREAITNTQPQTHNRTPLHSTPLHSVSHSCTHAPTLTLTHFHCTLTRHAAPHLTPHLTSPHLTLLTHSGAEDGLRLQTSSFACGFLPASFVWGMPIWSCICLVLFCFLF